MNIAIEKLVAVAREKFAADFAVDPSFFDLTAMGH